MAYEAVVKKLITYNIPISYDAINIVCGYISYIFPCL